MDLSVILEDRFTYEDLESGIGVRAAILAILCRSPSTIRRSKPGPGGLSVAYRASWEFQSLIRNQGRESERQNPRRGGRDSKLYVAPLGLCFKWGGPHPQLALWATNISLASPTG
jgi:hypothetical protein